MLLSSSSLNQRFCSHILMATLVMNISKVFTDIHTSATRISLIMEMRTSLRYVSRDRDVDVRDVRDELREEDGDNFQRRQIDACYLALCGKGFVARITRAASLPARCLHSSLTWLKAQLKAQIPRKAERAEVSRRMRARTPRST